MKLGNVPPEEWFEGQNHENNIELIKSKYIETGLKLFHNEKGRALGLASIDIIKEHKWFIDGVQKCDKRAFLDDLHKVNGRALYILAKHTGNMQVEFYSNSYSYFDVEKNKIFCNIHFTNETSTNKRIGFKLNTSLFLHEAGHWLDSNRFNGMSHEVSRYMPSLIQKISKDVIDHINKIYSILKLGEYKPIQTKDGLSFENINMFVKDVVICELLEDNAINTNISDLYGAVTKNIINSGATHEISYWAYNNKEIHYKRVTMEAVAEMFESLGHSDRMKAMRTFLPNAWGYFNQRLMEVF